MRFSLTAILVTSILMIAGGCFKIRRDEDSETIEASVTTESPSVSDPTETMAPETTAESGTEVTEPETTTVTVPETAPESTLLTDINSLEIYSSHAYMVSFDPSTGLAEFDYYDALVGQDAIDWLVEHEGYTQEDAENKVNNWADTEYIEKNINPQLYVIDMSTVPIISNVDENGFLALPPVFLTYSEFVARADEFVYSTTNNVAAHITVVNNRIESVNVNYFRG